MDEYESIKPNALLSKHKDQILGSLHLRRPPSTVPGRTRDHHPSQTTSRLQIGDGKPRWAGSQSAPSCFEPHGMGDASSGKQRVAGLFVIGHRGDYATKPRNVRKMTKADDAEVHNNRPTLLQ